METIAQEAKRALSPVPFDKWTVGAYNRGDKCCAIGHLRAVWGIRSGKEQQLRSAAMRFGAGVQTVNDGENVKYQQDHAKGRTEALLDDMIAAGY